MLSHDLRLISSYHAPPDARAALPPRAGALPRAVHERGRPPTPPRADGRRGPSRQPERRAQVRARFLLIPSDSFHLVNPRGELKCTTSPPLSPDLARPRRYHIELVRLLGQAVVGENAASELVIRELLPLDELVSQLLEERVCERFLLIFLPSSFLLTAFVSPSCSCNGSRSSCARAPFRVIPSPSDLLSRCRSYCARCS